MIGNDIVDILQSRKESNWQRKGFLEKLFTNQEQACIAQSSMPEVTMWLLWSMKEAAYKIYNRQTNIRAFIPKKLSCTIIFENEFFSHGNVICAQTTYYTKTSIANDAIHTIAVTSLEDLNQTVEIENKNIIKNKWGVPYLATETPRAVSISHHGRFEKIVTLSTKIKN